MWGWKGGSILNTVKPPIKDTPKEDKPPNKGQAKSTHVYTLYRKSSPNEDNLSTKDKTGILDNYHTTWFASSKCSLV